MTWESYLERYHRERPGITEAAFEHARDAVIGTPYDWLTEQLPARPGRVLDVACGSGPLRPRLAAADTYLGIDISDAELALARQRGRGPVSHADARRLPVADGSVDTVVSSMGLMLVVPVRAALAEIARALTPDGTFAALLPAPWPVHPGDLRPLLVLAATLRGAGAMPQHLSGRRLPRELARAGLAPVSVQRHRFAFTIRNAEDAALAVHALYTPNRATGQLRAAATRLARLAPTQLPLPLLRVTARRAVARS